MAVEERGYEAQIAPGATAPMPMASPAAFGAAIGEGLQQVGAALGRYKEAEHQLRRGEEATAASLAFEKAKGEIETYEVAAQNGEVPGILAGGGGYREMVGQHAREALAKVSEGITDKAVQRMVAERVATYQGDVDHRADVYAHGQAAIATADRVGERGNIVQARMERETTIDGYFRQAADDDAFRATLTGLNPEQAAAVDRDMDVRRATGFLMGRAKDEPAFALALEKSGRFDFLPANVRSAVRSTAEAIQARAAQQAKAAADEQIRQDKESEQIILGEVSRGTIIDPLALSAAAQKAGGRGDRSRAHELEIAAVKNRANTVYGTAAAAQLTERLGVIEADKAWRTKPAMVAEHDQIETLRSNLREAEPNFAQALNPADPGSYARREREAILDADRRQLPVPMPLGKDDLNRLQEIAKTGLAGQIRAADELANFSSGAAMAAARQVQPGNAMFMVATTLTPQSRALLLRGEEAQKLAPQALTPSVVEPLYGAKVRSATRRLGEDYQRGVKDATRLIAATLMAERGETRLTTAIWAEAQHRALGGTWARNGVPQGGMGAWNDKPVLLPYRMSQEDFDRHLSRITKLNGFLSSQGSVSAAELRRYYTPVNVGAGLFEFQDAAGRMLKGADGANAQMRITWNGK